MQVSRNFRRLFSAASKAVVSQDLPHLPVMVDLAVEQLKLSEGKTVLDMTFGAGGHTKKMIEMCPDIKVLALDRDPVAYSYAQHLAADYPQNLTPIRGKFSELPGKLTELGISKESIDGMLFDFGCSSMQMDTAHRGFSISKDGPLDMRMDNSAENSEMTAADILAAISEEDLAKALKVYGEERQAKKIARAIIEARYAGLLMTTTKELSNLVAEVCGFSHRLDKMHRHAHVATKVFQALRILVNNELNEINYAMLLAKHYVKKGGRLVTLTFHSLEDKIVKRHIHGNITEYLANNVAPRYLEQESPEDVCWKQINKHVICPEDEEVWANPRSRSAKLRVAEKIL